MSANKVRIRKGDTVVVIAGKDAGRVGKVLRVRPEDRHVTVEGVAVVKRHAKPTNGQTGGIISKEAWIDVSNVAFFDAELGRPVKIGFRMVDGKKVRFNKKTGAVLEQA
jgi:large subunit ribosomal protein L24